MPFTRTTSQSEAAVEFDQLLRPHVPALYRCAYRWTGTVAQAEDLVQDLLIRLYPRLDDLRGLDRIRPWALRVMYRIFVDQLRRERSSPVQLAGDAGEPDDDEADDPFADAGSADPADLLEQQLTQERVVAAWGRLVEEHRTVLSMHDIEGYSLVDLAEMMDVPVGTLKSRLHRARARLRELLQTERSGAPDRVPGEQAR